MGVIYKITSPSGRVYIGQTYDLRKRINAHKCAVKYGKNILLHNSIRKYGWDAHVLEIIETVDDSLLDEREIFWIKEFQSYSVWNNRGLNMTEGGLGHRSGWMHKTELRKFFSDKFSGEGNPFYGKKHTEVTKALLSENASKRNLREGRTIPKWGVEKGRQKVIKPVICYDINGVFVSEHSSVTLAGEFYSVSHSQICACCNKKVSAVSGCYVFRYKTENYPLKIDVGEINIRSVKKPVFVFDRRFNLLGEYPSSAEASEEFDIPKGTINRAAMYNNLHPIRKGFIFVYKDEAEKKFEEKGISIRIL